jgi:hydroxymethylpyrimidine pyrophosphatase-like HAD family hydrolase
MVSQRIIISDIDDVITLDRSVDERAIKRIKKMVDRGINVALATANTETRVREAVMPLLEKHGLVEKVPVFGEFGLYEIRKDGKVFSPEAEMFKSNREQLLAKIYEKAKKEGIKLLPDKENHLVTIKINAPRAEGTKIPHPEDMKRTRELIESAITNMGLEGKLHLNQTKRGFDVAPVGIDKSIATRDALRKWNLKEGQYRGFGFGNQFRDRKISQGPKMAFVEVIEADQFLKKSRFMRTRFLFRDLRRPWAGVKRKIGVKGRQRMGLARRK